MYVFILVFIYVSIKVYAYLYKHYKIDSLHLSQITFTLTKDNCHEVKLQTRKDHKEEG